MDLDGLGARRSSAPSAAVRRAVDGSECDWGYVTKLDPPNRILLAWHLNPEFDFDPDPTNATEVEVTFSAEGHQTRVTLTHRGFQVHGEAGAAVRDPSEGTAAGPPCCRFTAQWRDQRSFQDRVSGHEE